MTTYTATRAGIAFVALSLTATLVLSGCGDREDEVASAPESSARASELANSPTASAAPATEEPSGAGEESPQPVETEDSDAVPAPDSTVQPAPSAESDYPNGDPVAVADCLPGNWVPHREEFAKMMAGDTTKLVTGIDGDMFLSIRPDGTVNTNYENWTYTFTVDEATVTIVKDGTDEGAYTVADDGSVDITDTNIGSTTTANMDIGGMVMDQEVEPQPSVFSLATLTCSGDELTASVGSQVAVLGREH